MKFNLPELGENITSGTIVSIPVKKGDHVNMNDTLFELETQKAILEVPSPVAGNISELFIENNKEIKVGDYLLSIEEDLSSYAKPSSADLKKEASTEEKTTGTIENSITPSVNKIIKKQSQEISTAAPQNKKNGSGEILPPASPSVRQYARDIGVSLDSITGSGPNGRILKEDLKANTGSISYGEGNREKLTNLRKEIIKNMETSFFSIPHVTQNDTADITELEAFRKQTGSEGKPLTPSSFILKVLSKALEAFPVFNSSLDMENEEIIYHKNINIGIAVDTQWGLMVPVIRDIPSKSLFEIGEILAELSQRARQRKILPDEMSGGTFTLTNLGSIGGSHFTPIIRYPEAAILGTGRAQVSPVYVDNQFLPRKILPISLTYDHRIIDGAMAARFLRWIAKSLENPWHMEAGL